MKKNLRIVVSCVAFETVKIVEPIRYFRADRAYLLCMPKKDVYKAFVKEVKKQLRTMKVECVDVPLTIYEFTPVLKELLIILKKERSEGNHVYVNVEAGPQVYGAAAIVACMMEGGSPFFVGTKKFQVDENAYFQDGKPIGLSAEVYEPREVPVFRLEKPKDSVVKAFSVWAELKEKGRSMTDNSIVEELERKGLMKDIYGSGGKKISYKAKMNYRRAFLDKWIRNGWVRKIDRARYEITDFGMVALQAFDR